MCEEIIYLFSNDKKSIIKTCYCKINNTRIINYNKQKELKKIYYYLQRNKKIELLIISGFIILILFIIIILLI